ncbi:MAG: 50S ribosomal protein L17 [Patescibacteria group bacterium]
MRHLKRGRKLHRESAQRGALMKALMVALIDHGKIRTTEAKAKELRPAIEKMVTRARAKTVQNVRLVRRTLPDTSTKKLFDDIAARYRDRNGGYTRVVKLGSRRSDGSRMASIEFV